jgi:thiamine-phosphate diphosphorylase
MRPVMCMVTRRADGAAAEARLVRRVGVAALAGVHLVQIRERDLVDGALVRLVARCVEAVRATPTRIVVNDRLDVALAAGAHGVHLRGNSIAAARARAIAPPGFLVGRSVHTPQEAEQAAAAGGLDYLIFGTVFATESKPGASASGLDQLAAAVARTSLPVLAIGGVSRRNAGDVARTGAAGIAAIRLFADDDRDRLHTAASQVALAFDIPEGVP